MTAKQRIPAIRLYDSLKTKTEYAKHLGVAADIKVLPPNNKNVNNKTEH